jgi:hypothetical protein
VGFELTITETERAKPVHALDRSATFTGLYNCWASRNISQSRKNQYYLIMMNMDSAYISVASFTRVICKFLESVLKKNVSVMNVVRGETESYGTSAASGSLVPAVYDYDEFLPLCQFVHHESHATWLVIESGPSLREAGD